MQAAMARGMAPQTMLTVLQWRAAPSEYTRVMPALTVSAPLAPNQPLKVEGRTSRAAQSAIREKSAGQPFFRIFFISEVLRHLNGCSYTR